ncbi:raffinose/stachyose/melibiose transport system permease protein [Microbacterium foliorum]|uniref:carbohydrate ABC transporter permease n=1 Tax=Microbacterium foliorum TaxID=104336 RepID=UPI00209E83E1|nr:carbohydrate ABC transporter permease [Microbacterium foliorum]MCP1428167.1 raffinose/stachyose/melibiose transport system permease protein [Microbacterium foliorum]
MTRRTKVRAGTVVGHTGAILWSALAVIPFALIVLLAFKSNTDIYTDPLGLVGVDWRPENFTEAWNGAPGGQGFAVYLLNSAIVTAIAITGCLLVGALTAYFATLASARVRLLIVRLFLVATTLPLIMLLIPYYTAFNALDLLGSPWALGVLYIALCLPTCVLILHSFYLGFPSELAEAASIDGLGRFQTFLRIVLPLSKGPIVAVGMINAFFVWGETQLAIVLLQSPASRTIPVGLLDFKGQFASNTGAIFAGLTLATIPLIIVYLLFNRTITKGVALGGVFR